MEQLTIGQVASALALLVSFCGGVAYFVKPIKNFEKRLEKVEKHQENDNVRLAKLDEDTKQILLSVNALMTSAIDGNHTEQLRRQKEELNEYLIKR